MDFQKLPFEKKLLIDIKEINLEPGPFTMSFGFDAMSLIGSIKKIGLISPPIVIKTSSRGFNVVSGYRRLIALRHLDEKQVRCIDLTDSGLSPEELFLLNLHDNLTVRAFNLVEKGMIIHRLSSHISKEKIFEHYLSLLHISSINDFDVIMKIEQLNEQARLAIAAGQLSLKTIRHIIDMEGQSRDVLIRLIINLKLNSNYQYQFVEYLKDISNIENRSIHEILETDQYQTIIRDKRSNIPQKTKHLFALIRERKFPLLTESENTFRKRVTSLNLPDKISIEHPPFFEAPDFRLEISFKNGRELLEKIKHLSKLDALASIQPPWQANE